MIEAVSLFGDPEALKQDLVNTPGAESINGCAGIDQYSH